MVWRKEQEGAEVTAWTAVDAEDASSYAALFNLSDQPAKASLPLFDLELEGSAYEAIELWSGKESRIEEGLEAEIPAHGAVVYRLIRK